VQLLDQIALGFPHPIRFGLGLGEIVTDINREQSIGADGPAYWRARAAIEAIHEKDDYGSSRIAVSLGDKVLSQAVNTVLAALSKRLKSSGLKIYLRNRRLAMRMILQAAKEAEQ